jgi:signal transduction histidine kinase
MKGPVVELAAQLKEVDPAMLATLESRLAAAEESLRAAQRAREELQEEAEERLHQLLASKELLRAEMAERTTSEEQLKSAQCVLEAHAVDLEAKVAERTSELQAAKKSIETLCYSIAHDLRAPNRSMQGFAELLLAEHARALNPTGNEYLRRIAAAAARNDCLILDMLAYGRLSHTALPCSEHSLESSVQTVLQSQSGDITEKKAVIQIKSPLPMVHANPTALEDALGHLLSNALKFMSSGVTPEVTIWAEERADSVRVCVQDNGVGIPSEHHEKIFSIFERLHSAEAYPGTGMGLAIVQQAVDRMGGRVGLTSEPGRGSCFWIELLKPLNTGVITP